ncbi:MFS transporter [Agromyces sp. LHK192]|uniref:MFS transporter n=1 Tax=Agromyces sp. LHK192 TaxID=2498704 RepID=UPI000FDBA87A|nr:MFS transporter [Agromyces sp. LHK192]
MEGLPRERLYTPAFIALGIAELAYFTADGIAVFTLPLHVTGPIGGDEAAAGIAFGAFALSALLLRPLAGRLADRLGRRPLLLGGALIAAVSYLTIAAAPDLLSIIALRLLAGVAEAAFFVASFAALADLAPPSRLGEAISINSLGLYLGLTLGPPLGELLSDWAGFAAAWMGGATIALVAAAISVGVGETRNTEPVDASGSGGSSVGRPTPEPTRTDPTPRREPLIYRPALPILIGFLASIIALGGFLAFASLHAVRIGTADASTALLVFGAVVVVVRVAFARFVDRFPPLRLGAAALVLMAAGLAITAVWPAPGGLHVGSAILAIGVGFSTPAFFAAVFATAGPAQRGAASGTATAAIDLGLGLGPIALGPLAAGFGLGWTFAVAAAVAALGAVWTLHLASRPPAVSPPPRARPVG